MSAVDQNIERGIRWAVWRQVALGVLGTTGTIAYARYLTPGEVGQYALASIVFSGLFLLVQAPFRDAVVYFQDADRMERLAGAAFWLLLSFSLVGSALILAIATPLAGWYGSLESAPFIQGMTLAFFTHATAVVPLALLLKRFEFGTHDLIQTIADGVRYLGWFGLLVLGFGVWSLVWPTVASGLILTLASWWRSRFVPRWPQRAELAEVLRYSRSLLGSKLLIYLNAQFDNAAVGRLGERPLGFYTLGEQQSGFVVLGIGVPLGQITLPALAAVRQMAEESQAVFLKMLRLTSSVSTPVQGLVLVLVEPFISIAFGPQWLPAAPVLRAYLAYRLLHALLEICDAANSAWGRPQIRFRFDLLQLPLFVLGTWYGLTQLGTIAGIAWILSGVRLAVGLLYGLFTLQLGEIAAGRAFAHLAPSFGATWGAAGLIWWLQRAGVLAGGVLWVELLTLIGLGLVAYVVLLFMLDWRGSREVLDTGLKALWPGRKGN